MRSVTYESESSEFCLIPGSSSDLFLSGIPLLLQEDDAQNPDEDA